MRRVASAPVERAIAVGSVVASLLGQVNAVAALGLVAPDDAAGDGEAATLGAGDGVVRPGVDDEPPPPPPQAASKDVVTKMVAILRNIAILIVKSGGASVART
jgi:hypothetical protein